MGNPSGSKEAIAELPLSCADGSGCSGDALCAAAVCVDPPPEGVQTKVTDGDDKPTDDPPRLDCAFEAPPMPDGPTSTTLYGAVDRFGSGLVTKDIRVEIFLEETFDPSACEAEPNDDAKADCYRRYGNHAVEPDTAIGPAPIGWAVSVAVPSDVVVPETCNVPSDCPLGYECLYDDLDGECFEEFGLFEIDDVPTNTRLVIRSRATKNFAKWHDSYVFNVILFADLVDAGRYHFDASMVSHGQWLLTPNTVLEPEVPDTRGVVGGRIRDCREPGVRDSWPVAEVRVGLAGPASRVVYFNNLEEDTVPLIERESTNILGRFAALNIAPGWNRISGTVRIGRDVLPVGGQDVYVFPNALTIVSWPGMKPDWKQE